MRHHLQKAKNRWQVYRSGVWFVDIPRTSSTAIRAQLGQTFGPIHPKKNGPDEQYSLPQVYPDHLTALKMRDNLGNIVWDRVLTFGVVRNPWDRLMSLYFLLLRRDVIHVDVTLGQFAEKVARMRAGEHVDGLMYPPFRQSCSDFLCDGDGNLIVKKVVFFENRAAELAEIGARIGIPNLGAIKTNAARRPKDYKDFYDRATRDLVAETFAEDCERFGYRY